MDGDHETVELIQSSDPTFRLRTNVSPRGLPAANVHSPRVNNNNDNNNYSNNLPTKHTPPTSNSCLNFYYRFVNPWIRMLIIFPILYVYRVVLAISTYRSVLFQRELLGLPRPAITHPLYDTVRKVSPFILPDILYDVIAPPPYPSETYDRWFTFVDASPNTFIVFTFVLILLQRNGLRLTEYVGLHIIYFVLQTLLALFTNYPPASGVERECYELQHPTSGWWMARAISVPKCGDQMFSGHYSETLIAMIMVRRLLWDYFGWGFALTEKQEAKNYKRISQQAKEVKLAYVSLDDSSHHEGNKDFFFHPLAIYSTPEWVKKNRVLVWTALTLLRLIMGVWTFLLAYAQLHIRRHYSADILVAFFMMALLTLNRPVMVPLIRWLYRPAYWNYVKEGFFSLVYLKEPYTLEQLNYERRVSKVARGGVF